MSKFCPKCGKLETKNQQLIEGLCRVCFLKNNQLLEQHKELKIVTCPNCQSYLHQNKWHQKLSNQQNINIKKIISKTIPDKLKLHQGAKIHNIGIAVEGNNDKNTKKINIKLVLNGAIHNTKSKEEYFLGVTKEQSVCNICKKKNSSYYEAKIQIRPKNEKMLRLIKDYMDENGAVSVTREEENKHGYDLYLTNKKDLSKIITEVKKKFNVEVKISSTLYGRKDGREIYRTTVLLRLRE